MAALRLKETCSSDLVLRTADLSFFGHRTPCLGILEINLTVVKHYLDGCQVFVQVGRTTWRSGKFKVETDIIKTW